jgi:signal transduction histidine kinase
VSLLAFGMSVFLTFANPLPSYWQLAQRNLSTPFSYNGVPMLMIAFPVYMVLCIVLSMDALRKPGPTGRLMGEVARERARPWLMTTAGVLLLVSLLVTWAMVWIVLHVRETPFYNLPANLPPETLLNTIALFDLLISGLIGVSIVLLGQAVVAYEIFTGKALPRRSLLLQWWSAVVLAAGFSTLIGYSLTVATHPIYSLVLATILMVVFYAVFSWRSYVERERYMDLLRPFVTGRSLYGDLLDQSGQAPASQQMEIAGPFRVLCGEVLRAKMAYLAALGPLSPLVGPPLVYRATEQKDGRSQADAPVQLSTADLTPQFTSAHVMWVPVDPQRFHGASLAVPLWSERGLIGVMLLGEKRDGGLYTQEEIEIARASGERMVDTQASAEMARRLMSLQRRRLAESQVLDRQARRVLHDDVLPLLHTAMLALSSRKARVPVAGDGSAVAVGESNDVVASNGRSAEEDALAQLGDAHRRISDLLRDMPSGAAPQVARLGLLGALRKAVDEEFAGAFNEVAWQVEPGAERQAGEVGALAAEVLYYAAREAVRNASRYGRGDDPGRPLHLKISAVTRGGLELTVEDDGVGMAASRDGAGSGQGLALHSTMMAVVGGSLATESVTGKYTRVTLSLPKV